MNASLLTLTGEDMPDDVYTGGSAVGEYRENNLPAINYGAENPAVTWAKQNPLIVAALVVAAVVIISKMKKGR